VTPILEMRNITKRFPGVLADDRVNFDLRQGEIHALLGENGAGKSTLMNILFGLLQPDQGEIYIRGQLCKIHSPSGALALGVGMVHQHFMLVPTMTVLENVVLGAEPTSGPFLSLEKAAVRIRKLSTSFGLGIDPNRCIWQLSVGEQQRVEILKVLYRGADILILDEPTSVLTATEVEALLGILQSLIEQGKSIVFITHKLKEVMRICHRVTVMRRGAVQGTLFTDQTNEKQLANLLVGRDIVLSELQGKSEDTRVVVSLDKVSVKGDMGKLAVTGFSVDLHAGEILGIAGVDGNGQAELAEAIAGLRKLVSGRINLFEKDITSLSPWKRIDRGIMYIPADRKKRGVAPDLSIEKNSVLKNHRTRPFSLYGILQAEVIRKFARQLVKEYDVRAHSIDTLAGTLSGGNLQKLIVARELSGNPHLLVAEHPTHGLDIGAIEYVRNLLLSERKKGTAILLISSDLDEILALSDRILVMYEGEIVYQCTREEIDREKIGLAMAGFQKKV
jgi:general nucleoside transport system ATP-binding protein